MSKNSLKMAYPRHLFLFYFFVQFFIESSVLYNRTTLSPDTLVAMPEATNKHCALIIFYLFFALAQIKYKYYQSFYKLLLWLIFFLLSVTKSLDVIHQAILHILLQIVSLL